VRLDQRVGVITVATAPDFANAVLNHPAVAPDVGDAPLDVSKCVGDPNYRILSGEYGIFFVAKLFEGCWEVHTAILPEGRGEWTMKFAQEGAEHMFTATDCAELLTRVPSGHVAAWTLTHRMGFRYQFMTPPECLFRGKLVPVEVSSLSIQDWAAAALGMEERGARFHEWLNSKIEGEPHAPDRDHNRVVGVTLAMIRAGQPVKGVVWYNRWAFSARHALISLVSLDPVQVRFDAGILTLRGDQIGIEPCH
jgi:hypothetical protein